MAVPPSGSYEHLAGGDDAPTTRERLTHWVRRHRIGSALTGLALAIAATGALLLARPWSGRESDVATASSLDGVTVRVGRTDSTGTVVDGGGEPVVRIEAKVDLAGPPGTVGRVRGITGPGVLDSSSSTPQLSAGASVVGLVTARLRCADATRTDEPFLMVVEVAAGSGPVRISSPLDRLGRPWQDLVRLACTGR